MVQDQFDREKHWDSVYQAKPDDQMSWYQDYPDVSMQFISKYGGGKASHIIDVGGGSGVLADALLQDGYAHLSVLDISQAALDHAEQRLGAKARAIEWIHEDVLAFRPAEQYDIWHDRAAFHFLNDEAEVRTYVHTAAQGIRDGGLLVLATFSEKGPERCSNLPVHRYSQEELEGVLHQYFSKIECINTDHITPRETLQNFTFCAFRRNTKPVLN
jgi:2-polyprenyl-3-methyl-5-hydroxy-6-metoxy-1,4-benzoquinol methylase